jgi:Ni/Co efflux regulator RcnB
MRLVVGIVAATMVVASPVGAQSANTVKSVRTAYGARLSVPEGLTVNDRRVNSRINNRVSNRLSTRIQRYVPGTDPVAAYRAPVD